MKDEDIPLTAPVDGVMAGPSEIQQVENWAGKVFAGIDAQVEGLLDAGSVPFSFVYGGMASAQFLPGWSREIETLQDPEKIEHRVRWADPDTGLVVRAQVKVFKLYSAVEWVLHFENTGTEDTPILENIQALDIQLITNEHWLPLAVHRLEGDASGDKSFAPFRTDLWGGKNLRMAPVGGRSSNTTAFPFFNLQYLDQGVIAAIGWSGQWAAALDRDTAGPTHWTAGMELTHLLLHPGEKIRTPRMVIMPWKGDRIRAHNRWRRLMLFHYSPRSRARPVRLPIALQCFDRYSWQRTDWATEAGQIAAVTAASDMGVDHHWLDAAWFPGGFPDGVGNWSAKAKEFPNGLKPVSDGCHQKGLKFILWFEPERVVDGTQIAREHPEFVLGNEADRKCLMGSSKGSGLYKLNDPVARRFLTDLLSKRITEYGIDVYRNDFNIEPLSFWRGNDTPDRQGMTEIRYIEGLYEMWDELLARHPGLLIDNCASGGRRIDLEMGVRSVPLWRSDTNCSPGHPEWNQLQTAGLSLYIPFHTACAWIPDTYDFRSAATLGAIPQFDYMAEGFPMALAKASIAEAKENQKYWYGDFYPLTVPSISPEHYMAYQFHRADLDEGLVLAFRHAECNTIGLVVALQGLSGQASYTVDWIDEARAKTTLSRTGQELLNGLELRIQVRGESLLVRYKREH